MKEKELRQHAKCTICGEGIGKCSVPVFFRLRIEQFVLDLKAIQRQQGLTMQLGGAAGIAAAMGPDEEMTATLDSVTLTVCQHCAGESANPVLHLMELANDHGGDDGEMETASLGGDPE